jgi:hypothetical protein
MKKMDIRTESVKEKGRRRPPERNKGNIRNERKIRTRGVNIDRGKSKEDLGGKLNRHSRVKWRRKEPERNH